MCLCCIQLPHLLLTVGKWGVYTKGVLPLEYPLSTVHVYTCLCRSVHACASAFLWSEGQTMIAFDTRFADVDKWWVSTEKHSHAGVHNQCRLFCRLFCPIPVPLCMVFRCQIWLVMPDYDSYYSHYFVINSCLLGMLGYVLRQCRVLINMSNWYSWLFCCCQKEQLRKFMPVCASNQIKTWERSEKEQKVHVCKMAVDRLWHQQEYQLNFSRYRYAFVLNNTFNGTTEQILRLF